MEAGRTDFGGTTTFVNRKAFKRYIEAQEYHTEPIRLDVKHMQENRMRIHRSSPLSSTIETRVRHLLSGGIKIKASVIQRLGLRHDEITKQNASLAGATERQHFVQGVAFITASSAEDRMPIVLNPDEICVHVSFIGEHRRVFLVESRLPFKRRGAAAAAAVDAPEFFNLNTEESEWNGGGSSDAPPRHEFPWVLTSENAEFLAFSARFITPAWSLTQLEAFCNTTFKSAAMADTRRANPSVLHIHTAKDVMGEKLEGDYVTQGSGADARARRLEEKREVAAIHFEYTGKMDEMLEVASDLRSRLLDLERKQNPQLDPINDGPLYPTEPVDRTRKEPVPVGYTAVAAPTADVPPHLIASYEIIRESAGEVAGVPPALFGGSRSIIAANQTVLNTLQATLASRREVLGPVLEAVFWETYKYLIVEVELKEQRKQKSRKPAAAAVAAAAATADPQMGPILALRGRVEGWTKREAKEAAALMEEKSALETYRLQVDFMGFADPILAKELLAAGVITAKMFCTMVAGYSGLSLSNFEMDALEAQLKRKEELADIAVEVERVKRDLLQADLKLKEQAIKAGAAAAAAAAAAPQVPGAEARPPVMRVTTRSSAAAAATKNTPTPEPQVGGKRKEPSYAQVEGKSVDRKQMRFGGGKAMGTGRLSAKSHLPPPGTQGPHASR